MPPPLFIVRNIYGTSSVVLNSSMQLMACRCKTMFDCTQMTSTPRSPRIRAHALAFTPPTPLTTLSLLPISAQHAPAAPVYRDNSVSKLSSGCYDALRSTELQGVIPVRGERPEWSTAVSNPLWGPGSQSRLVRILNCIAFLSQQADCIASHS